MAEQDLVSRIEQLEKENLSLRDDVKEIKELLQEVTVTAYNGDMTIADYIDKLEKRLKPVLDDLDYEQQVTNSFVSTMTNIRR